MNEGSLYWTSPEGVDHHSRQDGPWQNCLSLLRLQEQRHWYVHKTTTFGNMNDGSWTWDVRYAHYALDLNPSDCNHTVVSFVRLLCDLEQAPVSSFCELFHGAGRSPLYHVVIYVSDICLQWLTTPPTEPIPTIHFHPFCMFSSIIVGRTTNVGSWRHFGLCSRPKGYKPRSMCLNF